MTDYLNVYDNWMYGPMLEVRVVLERARLRDLNREQADKFLRHLDIALVDLSIDGVLQERRDDTDWRTHPRLEGVWRLDDTLRVGVVILPLYADGDLFLSIPPRFVHIAFGNMPWFKSPREGICRLHELLLQRLECAHGVAAVRTILIQVEAETGYSVGLLEAGVHMDRVVLDTMKSLEKMRLPWRVHGYAH